MMTKYEEYQHLSSSSYDDAVKLLLQKYGPAKEDYYREKPYEELLAGKRDKLTRVRVSRTSEGLECHHIAENRYLNMAKESFIKQCRIPYDYQKKDYLVYADAVEHMILHALISKETSQKYGLPGYLVYLAPRVKEWYVNGVRPTVPWQLKCYQKAFLEPNEASKLLDETDAVVQG